MALVGALSRTHSEILANLHSKLYPFHCLHLLWGGCLLAASSMRLVMPQNHLQSCVPSAGARPQPSCLPSGRRLLACARRSSSMRRGGAFEAGGTVAADRLVAIDKAIVKGAPRDWFLGSVLRHLVRRGDGDHEGSLPRWPVARVHRICMLPVGLA